MLFRITEVLRAPLGIWYRVAVRIGLLAGALYNGCMNGTHTRKRRRVCPAGRNVPQRAYSAVQTDKDKEGGCNGRS